MADLKITADYSELTGLIKTTDQTKRAVQLLGNTLANTKDSSSYMRGINQIVEAQKKLAPSARMSRSEIMKLGAAMKQEAEFAKALAAATTQADAATGNLGRKMSRTGVVFQQAGYQIGDFAVQVQSGTHYMVALGQQLTQLVGVGAMLARSTAWIAAFSALGVIVPIATAVAGAFMRIKKESKGLKDAEENVKSLTKAVEEWKIAKAALDLGVSSDVYKGMKAFEIAVENTRETLRTLRQDLLESGEESVMKVVAQDLLAKMGIGGGSLEAQAQAALDKYEALGELLKSLRQIELEKKDQFVQKLDRELQLQQEINRFGEDSLQVADLKLQFEKEDLAAQAEKLGFSKDEIALLVDKLSLIESTRQSIEDSKEEAKKFAEILRMADMSHLIDQSKSLADNMIMAADAAAAALAARSLDVANERNIQYAGRGTTSSRPAVQVGEHGRLKTVSSILAEQERARKEAERAAKKAAGTRVSDSAFAFVRQFFDEDSAAMQLEQAELWRTQALEKLANFNAKELELLRQHNINKQTIEEEYQSRVAQIEAMVQDQRLANVSGFFGALATVASAGGKKMAKAAAIFGAIEATVNAWRAFNQVLADPDATFVEKLAKGAAVLAAGMRGVAAIRQAGGVGGGGGAGGAGGGRIATPSASGSSSPQKVLIQGIGPNDLITGSQLSEIFDKLYEENENRGLVFQIAS